MIAGVTIPGVGLGLLAIAQTPDKNRQRPKVASSRFRSSPLSDVWAVLVSTARFRGPGFNFVFQEQRVFFGCRNKEPCT